MSKGEDKYTVGSKSMSALGKMLLKKMYLTSSAFQFDYM